MKEARKIICDITGFSFYLNQTDETTTKEIKNNIKFYKKDIKGYQKIYY